MRIGLSVMAILGLAACEVAPGQFDHEATLQTDARGVALDQSGDVAQVGMFGTTCDVFTSDASVGTDYDYPSEQETVVDIAPAGVLIISPDRVHVQGHDWTVSDINVTGVVDAGFSDQGVVAIADTGAGCEVNWTDIGSDVAVDATLCNAGSFDVTPGGAAIVGTGDGVFSVDSEGSTIIDSTANLAAFDSASGILYVAELGGLEVRGLDLDGTEVWNTQLDGAVRAVTEMGDLGRAGVSIQKFGGHGEIVTIDGLTGEIISRVNTPNAAEDLSTSGDGTMVAVDVADAVHFFRTRE